MKPDAATTDRFFGLMTGTGYREPLRVALFEEEYLLLPSYGNYKARAKMVVNNPEQEVECIVVEGGSWKDLLMLSCQLDLFSNPSKPHLNRLITMELLYEAYKEKTDEGKSKNKSEKEIEKENIKKLKEGLGISETNSTGKRQLQKDLRLIKCPELLSRVIGVDFYKDGEKVSIIEAICTPKTINIYMTAAQADKILAKTRGDKEVLRKILKAYDDEYDRLNQYCANPKLVGKPIYQWKDYFSFGKMLEIAENIATGHGYNPKEEDEEMKDHSWTIAIDDETGECSIPAVKFNRDSNKPKDLKIYLDVIYSMERFVGNSLAHFDRIRPAKHGGRLKVDRDNLKPNKPKFDDVEYLKSFIRRKKMIKFSNRSRILKCLRLKPQFIGYKTTKWDEFSTYSYARERYDYWWENKFLKEVERWHGGKKLSHPHYKIYNYIRAFLWMMSKPRFDKNGKKYDPTTRQISFYELFNNLFSYVLRRIDRDEKQRGEKLEDLFNIERNLIGHNWAEIDKALERDGKVQLSREQLESILQERESAIATNIAIQNRKLEEQQDLLEEMINPFHIIKNNEDDLSGHSPSRILN